MKHIVVSKKFICHNNIKWQRFGSTGLPCMVMPSKWAFNNKKTLSIAIDVNNRRELIVSKHLKKKVCILKIYSLIKLKQTKLI